MLKLAGYDNEAPNVSQPIIRVCHDESTFYVNADQLYHWLDRQLIPGAETEMPWAS